MIRRDLNKMISKFCQGDYEVSFEIFIKYSLYENFMKILSYKFDGI